MATKGKREQNWIARTQGGETYLAYCWSQAAAMYPHRLPPRLRSNPFPKGKRHDEWERGTKCADPMGDWHGRNA